MADIRVHIDTLEYTRRGLRTRERIPLQVGQHNRVVLVRPRRSPAVAASFGGFPAGLSFPAPAVLSMLQHDHTAPDGAGALSGRVRESNKVQVFAHADAVGDETENKVLSDRRAQCVRAVLVRDVGTVVDIAAAERWGPELEQVMLRALGCDPGPIDGKHEVLTSAAVSSFQARYVEGMFHEPGEPALQPELEATGTVDENTRKALIDAYVSTFSPRLSEDAFVTTGDANGCGAFNPAAVPDDSINRRVSVVVHPGPLPHPEALPCVEGDAPACAVVEGPGQHTCLYFREHVVETPFEEASHHHFRPSWLKLTNGNYMLSVLTTVPDAEEVEFQVFASSDPGDGVELPDPSFYLHDLGEVISQNPVLGVAQVVWEPPADFEPGEDGRASGPSGSSYVPMFRVSHARTGTRLHDSYPATEIVVLLAREELDGPLSGHEGVEFELRHDSGLTLRKGGADARPYDSSYLALRFSGVPAGGRYSLELHFGETIHREIFTEVAYESLCADDDTGEAPASTCAHWTVPPAPPPLGDEPAGPNVPPDLLGML